MASWNNDSTVEKISNLCLEDNASQAMPPGAPIKILLMGKTGSGKSSAGNLILSNSKDEDVPELFMSTGDSVSVTAKVKKVTREIYGRSITVVDTPGVCDTTKSDDITLGEIASAVVESPDGYDAFVIVLRYPTRMTAEERKAVTDLTTLFGEGIYGYTIVIFTYGNTFKTDQRRAVKRGQDRELSIEEFVKQDEDSQVEGAIGPVLKKFKGGIVLIDNLEEDWRKREAMVAELVKRIDKVRERNKNVQYTNFMFEIAKKKIEEETRKIEEEKKKVEAERVRKIGEERRRKNEEERRRNEEEAKKKAASAVKTEAKSKKGCTIL